MQLNSKNSKNRLVTTDWLFYRCPAEIIQSRIQVAMALHRPSSIVYYVTFSRNLTLQMLLLIIVLQRTTKTITLFLRVEMVRCNSACSLFVFLYLKSKWFVQTIPRHFQEHNGICGYPFKTNYTNLFHRRLLLSFFLCSVSSFLSDANGRHHSCWNKWK